MTRATEIRQKAIALIGQLSQDKLVAVVQLLEFLAELPQQSAASDREAELLEEIEKNLPQSDRVRLNILRDRCEWGELSEAENQELIGYEDLIEQQRVERLEALIELATLKNIDLVRLNQQVQSESPSSYAV